MFISFFFFFARRALRNMNERKKKKKKKRKRMLYCQDESAKYNRYKSRSLLNILQSNILRSFLFCSCFSYCVGTKTIARKKKCDERVPLTMVRLPDQPVFFSFRFFFFHPLRSMFSSVSHL